MGEKDDDLSTYAKPLADINELSSAIHLMKDNRIKDDELNEEYEKAKEKIEYLVSNLTDHDLKDRLSKGGEIKNNRGQMIAKAIKEKLGIHLMIK